MPLGTQIIVRERKITEPIGSLLSREGRVEVKAETLENSSGVQRDRDNIRKLELRVNGAEDSLQAHLT